MKKIIKNWLGISEIEEVLTAPEKGFNHIGGELDVKLEIKKFEEYKEYLKRIYADCFNCGATCRKSKMKVIPAMSRDVQEGGVLSEYNLLYAFHSLSGENWTDEKTQPVFFCKNCPAEIKNKGE